MKTIANLVKFSAFISYSALLQAQVIMTEVMFNLDGSDSPNEFIELYNTSQTDSINLNGWTIRDNYSLDDLEDNGSGLILPPAGYGLILEGDYIPGSGLYTDLIPGDLILIKVDDKSIGNGLSIKDSLFLINAAGHIVDSLGWEQTVKPGFSLEKIRLEWPNLASNWKASRDSLGTPGKPNSVKPLSINGVLLPGSLQLTKFNLSKSEQTLLSGRIMNAGLFPFSSEITVFDNDKLVGEIFLESLNELDTTSFSITLGPFTLSGKHNLNIILKVPGDKDTSNNSDQLQLAVQFDWNIVTINEFMALPNNDQTEFLELVSREDLIFEGWSFGDKGREPKLLPAGTFKKGDFIVIADDSTKLPPLPQNAHIISPYASFPVFNNSGDALYLYDLTGLIIDSLIYDGSWPLAAEISTEKLRPEFKSNDPANWALAENNLMMTPGQENSVLLGDLDGVLLSDSIFHNPLFPAAGENMVLTVGLTNAGLLNFSGFIAVGENGLEIERFNTPDLSPGDSVTINLDMAGLTAGLHVLNLELIIEGDSRLNNNYGRDSILVSFPWETITLNEFLAQPDSQQTEFVELTSRQSVSLAGWSLSNGSKLKKALPPVILSGGSYLIIARDSSLINHTPFTSTYLSPPGSFPSLKNTGDGIFLFDLTGSIIDSLIYTQNWPLSKGRSTEKFKPEYSSADSSSWGLSVNAQGYTPGSQNSIHFETIPDRGSVKFEPNPFSPDMDGRDDILFIKYNLPYENSALKVQIFDITGRKIATPSWNRAVAQNGVLYWDGRNSTGQRARMGIYIIKIRASDLTSNQFWENIQTVILAYRLN